MAFTGKYFNSSYYLTENTDVANKWTSASALSHYTQYGALEGRAPNSWFNAQYYRANNADLGSMNALQLFDHYENHGYKEGRITSTTYANFDSAKYLADYADLGTNGITAGTALSHYFQYGITEGRVAKNTDGSLITTATTGATYTLTTGADALTGDANNNTFVATESTLSSADLLNGGNGTDTLRYASSGSVAVNESGFETLNIEKIQVTSDATGGTTFDVTGSTGLTTLINSNSSTAVTFTGGKSIVAMEMNNVSLDNTTITYDSATIAGTTDLMSVSLNGNRQIDGTAIGTLRANGIETFAVTTTGAASLLTEIASTSLKAMTIAGNQNLTLSNANFFNTAAVNTVDASTFTGALNITASNSGAANIDVKVTGGTGNDRANFSNGWDTSDEFNGGLGTDTLALTQAVATAVTTTTAGTVSNVEILEITDPGTGIVDMDNFSGITTVYYSGGLGGATTVQDTGATQTVQVDLGTVAQNLTTTLKTNGTADTLNLTLSKIGAADLLGTATAANFETINLMVTDDAAVVGTGAATVADLVAANTTKLTVTNTADLTLSAATTTALTTLDASASTGKLTLTGVDFASTGATVTLGSGNDVLTIGTAAGADTIDLSKGGNDRIVYTALAQSSSTGMDIIKGFTAGSDDIDLTGLLNGEITSSSFFGGTKATFAQAQGALSGGANNLGVQSVFQADEGILWVDIDDNGTLDAQDFRVKLDGVSSIAATDLNLGAGVTFTANVVGFNTATAANSNENNAVTNQDDTINATIAQLVGSTIDGLLGEDTLTLTTAGAVGAMAAQNVETLALASVSTTANTAVSFAATTDFKNVTGSSNADTVSLTNLVAGGTVNLGAGVDNITGATEAIVEGTGSTFVGGTGAAGEIDVFTFAAAMAATGNLDLSSISGFETLDLGAVAGAVVTTAGKFASNVTTLKGDTTAANITVNMTAAQLDALTTINSVATGNTFAVVVNDTGAITVDLSDTVQTTAFVDNISFAASSSATVTVGGEWGTAAAADALTFGTGADTFNINGVVASAGGRTYNLGGGADTVNVNIADGIVTATDLDGSASTTSILNVNANVTTAALTLQTNMNIFGTVNFTVDQVSGGNTVTINNNATTVTAKGGDFILGTGGDTFTSSGTAANIVTGGTGNDTITFNNTLGNTVNTIVFGTASGLDTINLNATNGVADTIALNDGAGTVGLALSTDRFTVNGFSTTNDIIRLDTVQTTAGTAAGVAPVVQSVGAAGALLLASATADITILNFDLGGGTAVLPGVLNGAALLANLGGAMTAAAGGADDGYILAYDNGNAYMYAYTNATTAGVLAAEIALIGTINNVAVGSLGVGNFTLAA